MNDKPIEVELADDSTPYQLRELCEMCAVRAEFVVEMVEAGILSPSGSPPSGWRFGVHAIIRLQKAQRLQRDLDINLAGIALALDLIEDLDRMKKKARMLEHHLKQLINDE
ncbi:MAG: chaperone modulatory protein CbpM [Gammaproteobacteria bacterium]|jgi:chaperone modulatory protein CbpM